MFGARVECFQDKYLPGTRLHAEGVSAKDFELVYPYEDAQSDRSFQFETVFGKKLHLMMTAESSGGQRPTGKVMGKKWIEFLRKAQAEKSRHEEWDEEEESQAGGHVRNTIIPAQYRPRLTSRVTAVDPEAAAAPEPTVNARTPDAARSPTASLLNMGFDPTVIPLLQLQFSRH